MSDLVVTITGTSNSGKSSLSELIRSLLDHYDIEASVEDQDGDEYFAKNFRWRLDDSELVSRIHDKKIVIKQSTAIKRGLN